MCTCTTLPNGNIVVCPTCATTAIEMLQAGGTTTIDALTNPFTPSEYEGLFGAVDAWLVVSISNEQTDQHGANGTKGGQA